MNNNPKNISSLIDLAAAKGCEVKRNIRLSELTSFHIGGPVEAVLSPSSPSVFAALLKSCSDLSVKATVLGNGSNVLAPDEGLQGVVFKTNKLTNLSFNGETVLRCGVGIPLTKLCHFAYEHALTGLEFAYGIPGSLGGAAYMNAGAYGGEMKDVVLCCAHIDDNFNEGSLFAAELDFGYRTSAYTKNGFVITGITLELKRGKKSAVKARMDELMNRRIEKQPLDLPSAGSVFKRPVDNYAGALIEECGLKGFSIGGAAVSEKHAGFIVNTGGASCADVLKLIKHIQGTVYTQTGIRLETEIKVLE